VTQVAIEAATAERGIVGIREPKAGWMDDDKRREEARIPWSLQFATKPELGLQLIRQALDDHVPPGVVLADEAYGASEDFRDGIRSMGLHYAVGIDAQMKVMVYDKRGRRRDEKVSVKHLALRIESRGGFRRTTWRHGTRGPLSPRLLFAGWSGPASSTRTLEPSNAASLYGFSLNGATENRNPRTTSSVRFHSR
jgi:hypothetical protein